MNQRLLYEKFVVGLIALNTIIAGELIGSARFYIVLSVLFLVSLTSLFLNYIRPVDRTKTLQLTFICLAMLSGMLIGGFIDFGRYGLLLALEMCQAQANGQLFQAIKIAPWTHIGMVLACSIAIVCVQKTPFKANSCIKHVCCLISMFYAMSLMNLLPGTSVSDLGNSLEIFSPYKWDLVLSLMPLTMMWLAMSVAMAVVFFGFEYYEINNSK